MWIFQRICKQKTIVNPKVDHKGLDSFYCKPFENFPPQCKNNCNLSHIKELQKQLHKGYNENNFVLIQSIKDAINHLQSFLTICCG